MRPTVRYFAVGFALIVAACGYASSAAAATCTINGIARECDFNCPGGGGSTCNPEKSHANCDDDGDTDGFCVICGTASAEFIIGTSGNDWICAKGGNDEIWDYDVVNSVDSNNFGDDTVDASGGNDVIYGDAGDDHLLGDAGNDTIQDYAGANALDGGTGDDTIVQPTSTLSTRGGVYCGGEGNDRLEVFVTSSGFFCIDCGDGQSASGTDYDAEYLNVATGSNTGSVRNCDNPNPSNDTFSPPVPCGCRE